MYFSAFVITPILRVTTAAGVTTFTVDRSFSAYPQVRGAATYWPAVQKWNVEYLRRHAGTELVDVEISVNGGDYRDAFVEADKDGREFYKLSMQMEDYLNYFLSKRLRSY